MCDCVKCSRARYVRADCCFFFCLFPLPFLFFVSSLLEVVMSFRRSRMGRSNSRKVFSRGAQRVHPRNIVAGPMRGGIRL